MPIRITLYGSKADRFQEIKEQLEKGAGYELSRPEVVGRLMEEHEGSKSGSSYQNRV